MLSLLNFIDTGFLITLGIICLTSGLIMLYCYRRLNLLENSIIEHGKILQSFIMNYNNQMVYNKSFIEKGFNTENTYKNSDKNPEDENLKDNEKIYVSDEDEETNDDSVKILQLKDKTDDSINEENSDSDSEEDSDSDSEEDDDSNSDEESDKDEISRNIKSINIMNNDTKNNDDSIKELITDIENTSFSEILSCDVELEKIDTNDISSKIIELNNDKLEEIDKKISVGENPNYKKMKVDDLRILVVTKNLTDNDNALKLKKDELIKLLN